MAAKKTSQAEIGKTAAASIQQDAEYHGGVSVLDTLLHLLPPPKHWNDNGMGLQLPGVTPDSGKECDVQPVGDIGDGLGVAIFSDTAPGVYFAYLFYGDSNSEVKVVENKPNHARLEQDGIEYSSGSSDASTVDVIMDFDLDRKDGDATSFTFHAWYRRKLQSSPKPEIKSIACQVKIPANLLGSGDSPAIGGGNPVIKK